MKIGFFRRTAWSNIKKNYRFFIPRFLAEAGLLGVFFIIYTLKTDERIRALRGGDYLAVFMSIGLAVMILLSAILMLYINGFLMKQRKREFGLYNVLGMEKRHVCRVLFFETATVSAFSVVAGLGLGMLFYKLCSLLICALLKTEVILGFYFIKPDNLLLSALFFLLLDLATYAFNCIRIARMKPVELLSSRASGEKEPKVKWLMFVVGLLSLAGGYTISIVTKQPLSAILLFFVAILLVILGTYFLFVSGSIFVLKALKRNPRIYYDKKRMPSISGLLYRMKQNAVGLASICILATGVLVMISTTVSLYAGMEDTVQKNYPEDVYVHAKYYDAAGVLRSLDETKLGEILVRASDAAGLEIEKSTVSHSLNVAYLYKNGAFTLKEIAGGNLNLSDMLCLIFITDAEYGALTGTPLSLGAGEIALCQIGLGNDLVGDRAAVTLDGETFTVARRLDFFPIGNRMSFSNICYGVVVPDEATYFRIYESQLAAYGDNASSFDTLFAVKYREDPAVAEKMTVMNRVWFEEVGALIDTVPDRSSDGYAAGFDSKSEAEASIFGMYAGLLFLGLILGAVFLCATALIIYYKQISEGYEDRERYQIMAKIGMSAAEIRTTVNHQVLLVFFLPLVAAGVHLAFAFPILERLLHILLLSDTTLFVVCSLVTFAVFAAVYIAIYSATAKTYYKIVN